MSNFKKVNSIEYAEKIKSEFYENPDLWHKVIIPKKKAEELKKIYNGDYSLIWHVHCSKCFSIINKNTGECYLSEDNTEWLCMNCYNEIHS